MRLNGGYKWSQNKKEMQQATAAAATIAIEYVHCDNFMFNDMRKI